MIDLAPAHKIGLSLKSPLMPAAGFWGYGPNRYAPLVSAELLGAIVTNPMTLRPRRAGPSAPVAEVDGGIILPVDLPNPGLKKIIRQNRKFWRRAPIPLIAHLPADAPDDLARTVSALDALAVFAGFELGLPPDASPADAALFTRTLIRNTDLPALVKLPFPGKPHLAEAALKAGAVALTLADAPPAAAGTTAGRFFGGGVHAQLLPHLQHAAETFPGTPIIACGGIHTPADVRACLQAGAIAAQLDSVFWANPQQVQQILRYAQGAKSDDPLPSP